MIHCWLIRHVHSWPASSYCAVRGSYGQAGQAKPIDLFAITDHTSLDDSDMDTRLMAPIRMLTPTYHPWEHPGNFSFSELAASPLSAVSALKKDPDYHGLPATL